MASNFFKINQVQGDGYSELYSEFMASNFFKTLNQVQGDGLFVIPSPCHSTE